jgi:hypothetical protein
MTFKKFSRVLTALVCLNLIGGVPSSAVDNQPLYPKEKRGILPSWDFVKRGFKSCTKNCQDKKICVNGGKNKDWQWCLKNCSKKQSNGQKWDMDKLFQHVCKSNTQGQREMPGGQKQVQREMPGGQKQGQGGMPGGQKTANAMKVLGLDPTTATCDILKKQYRKMAVQHHPDKGGSTQKMAEINDANDVLRPLLCE